MSPLRRVGQVVAVATGLVAVVVVLLGWLQSPEPLDAGEAVEQATDALASAGVTGARVAPDPSRGTHDPPEGDPIPVWKTVATLEGGSISLWLAEDDGEPVFLDDRSPTGATHLLTDPQFDALTRYDADPNADRLLRRNLALTAAAAAVAVLSALLATLPATVPAPAPGAPHAPERR